MLQPADRTGTSFRSHFVTRKHYKEYYFGVPNSDFLQNEHENTFSMIFFFFKLNLMFGISHHQHVPHQKISSHDVLT